MMQFKANVGTAKTCFSKYKLNTYFYGFFFVIVALANIVSTYQKYHHIFFTIFLTMVSLAILFGGFYSMYRGSISMNTSVKSVEVTNEKINFQTFDAAIYLGLLKKSSMNVEIQRNLADFKLSARKYGFNQKYTGDVYILSYAGDDYLIESNFFENFSELKRNLESN